MMGAVYSSQRQTQLSCGSEAVRAPVHTPSYTFILRISNFANGAALEIDLGKYATGFLCDRILELVQRSNERLAMAIQAPTKTAFEKWQDGLSKAVGDSRWDAYDSELRTAVGEFNQHLKFTAGYRQLNWLLIKAMLWTESGALSPEWKTKPMQIGVPGDPGLSAFLSDREGGELIVPPKWQGRLSIGTVRSMPSHNIRAGIGYLLMRMAKFRVSKRDCSGRKSN